MNRRGFLTRGVQGAVLAALFAASPAQASSSPRHIEWWQRTGVGYPFPPGDKHLIPWPIDSDTFPDIDGWMSADRTIVSLKTPGVWLVTWNVTFNPSGGKFLKTSLDREENGVWINTSDGNELAPTRGDESTLVGLGYVISDGTTRIRIKATHDLLKPLRISDRWYECHLHVALT